MRSAYAFLLGLLLAPFPAWADDAGPPAGPPGVQEAVDQVRSAAQAADEAALATLAARAEPDPWIIVEALLDQGAARAATAFARATSGPAVAGLPTYVAAQAGRAGDEAGQQTLAALRAALAAKDWAKAIEVTDGRPQTLDTVLALRIALGRGVALRALKRGQEGAVALRALAEAARALGWLSLAARAEGLRAGMAFDAHDWAGATTAWNLELDLARVLGDKAHIGRAHHNLALARRRAGNYPEALAHDLEALRARREVGEAGAIAASLLNLGIVQQRLGQYPQALRSYAESQAILRERGNRVGVAKTILNIGLVQRHLGDYPQALRSAREALGLFRELRDAAGIADALNSLGTVQNEVGDYAQALGCFEESLAIDRGLGRLASIAATLNNAGLVHRVLGQYPEALRDFEESSRRFREVGDRAGGAKALNNIGTVQEELGDYPAAIHSYEASLAIKRELGDRVGTAWGLQNLGNIEQRQRHDARALELYGASLAIQRELGHKAAVAALLTNCGTVHKNLGDLARARTFHEEALAVWQELDDRPGRATALGNLGVVAEREGHPVEALRYQEEALQLARDLGERTAQIRALYNIAAVRLGQGDLAGAAQSAAQAVDVVADVSAGLAEGEGAGARDVFTDLFELGYRASLRAGQVEGLLGFLEQGRAGSLREGLGSRAALEAATVPEALRADLALARAGQRQALGAYRKAAGAKDLNAVRATKQRWQEAQAEVGRVVARIQREAKAAAAVTLGTPARLDAIQRALSPGEALLLFGLTHEEGCALVVTARDARLRVLPSSQAIESAVDAVLDDPTRPVAPDAVPALRRLLIEPLALGEDVTRVLVSPTGRLGYVPFSLLLPEQEVAYVPSGSTYLLLREERAKRGERVLGLGDPDYAASADGAALRGLVPLPGTRGEVEAVADVRVLGAAATEAGLRSALGQQARWRAVHFACHGLVDPERPLLSSLALTASAGDDGLLTALEIFRMPIAADLVVLSACETGKGRIYLTEGIVGLTRAFMFAGAPRVICSLWKVDDEATRALMVKFYELWHPRADGSGGAGLGAAAALRAAQAFVRSHERWRHPYYWAAWVLWGLPE